MNVKTVSVSYERKIDLGQWNSVKVACTLWADLDSDDDEAACMTALWTMAKANVKAQVLPLKAKQEAQVEQVFLGLPVELRTLADDSNHTEHTSNGGGNGHAN